MKSFVILHSQHVLGILFSNFRNQLISQAAMDCFLHINFYLESYFQDVKTAQLWSGLKLCKPWLTWLLQHPKMKLSLMLSKICLIQTVQMTIGMSEAPQKYRASLIQNSQYSTVGARKFKKVQAQKTRELK